MQLIIQPERQHWPQLLSRPYLNNQNVVTAVADIISQVRKAGDEAIRRMGLKFDGAHLDSFLVSEEELAAAVEMVDKELKDAIAVAKANLEKFHGAQVREEPVLETLPGVRCWRRSVAIDHVGLYIPGGTAPLFSTVLMLAIPASIAGCKSVSLFTPPGPSGNIHPSILYAAQLCGITQVYKIGGAQAIAAMAYGTTSVQKVDKIFGPGNQYVTAAKQLVQTDGIAIDMPAGPSEVCILADESAQPSFVAADLLSQAEHGKDSQVLLVTTAVSTAEAVMKELEQQLQLLPRSVLAKGALDNSRAVVLTSMEEALEFVNEYAAEHLILSCHHAETVAMQVRNAGSVFIGHYSPESVGDYASGTNHTLPTNGYARAYSGVSVDSFVKKITYQQLTPGGLELLSNTVIKMAEAEGLEAHAQAVRIRIKNL